MLGFRKVLKKGKKNIKEDYFIMFGIDMQNMKENKI